MTRQSLAGELKMAWKWMVNGRQRSYWILLGVTSVCLGAFLMYVTSVTPYQQPQDTQLFYLSSASSRTTSSYQRARVVKILEDKTAQVELMDGNSKGKSATVTVGSQPSGSALHVGDTILVVRGGTDSTMLAYVGKYRIPALGLLLALFIILVVMIGGRRGASSIIGLLLSILVIGWFIIPLILKGHNVLLVAMAGSYVIALFSVLVAHGIRKRTIISIGCILAILTGVAVLAWITTWFVSLTGLTDEMTYTLSFTKTYLDMRGILIGGIIIATLGVLDDVVTTQVATVEELHRANPAWGRAHLFASASSVGGEHIASLVNTLALAYAGASLPYIILLAGQPSYSPILNINSEYIATEVVRTLVASIGLIVAVPISTLVAAVLYARSSRQYRKYHNHTEIPAHD